MAAAEARIDGCVAYRALVRYDAYGEMSGQQSSSIALLDTHRSGVVLSSILHRESARVYVKQIVEGESELELSPEEREAVNTALGELTVGASRVAFLGPAGTYTEEALLASADGEVEAVPCATVHETVMAVQDGRDRPRRGADRELARGRRGGDARRARGRGRRRADRPPRWSIRSTTT